MQLREVISTDLLDRRPPREPAFAAENAALLALADAMAQAPDTLLQRLVDRARELCRADSAGISLLEAGREGAPDARFRWVATSGRLGPFVGATLPRDFSPCGAVLDANAMLLMSEPERVFDYVRELGIPICEVLLIPFQRGGVAIGTLWLVQHTHFQRFDSEDARLARSLSQFAGAAVQVVATGQTNAQLEAERRRAAESQLEDLTGQHLALVQSDADKAHFLATLSHELRNCLAPIFDASHLLKLPLEASLHERARGVLDRRLAMMRRLVDDLLDTARLTVGKLQLSLDRHDLGSVVREAVDAARPLIDATSQQLVLHPAPDPLPVRADAVRLAQVFGNLLSNAAKYGVPGGTVTVTVERSGALAVVRIADEGIGIEPGLLPRLFDNFFQTERSVRHAQGGLGIGLWLVKGLLDAHSGRIGVHSDGPGRGSTFTVSLPLVD